MVENADDKTKGCCFCIKKICVNLILFLDFFGGIALLIYAGYVEQQGLMQAAAILLAFGLLAFLSVMFGIGGLCTKMCSRCGLVLSASMAMVLGPLEIASGILIVAYNDDFIQYLRDNKDALRLSDGGIQSIKDHSQIIMIGLCVLGFLEISRFFMTTSLRKSLLDSDTLHSHDPSDLSSPLLSASADRSRAITIPENEPADMGDEEMEKRWNRMLNDVDASTVHTKDSRSITSADDFAPVDEPLYTDPHWWAKSGKDTENDMSWVVSPVDKAKKSKV